VTVTVHVNGEPRELATGATVATVVESLGAQRARRGVAVAVDAEVVPRRQWERRELREGERVEVLNAIQGG
jgi:sulfur carrier protein